MNRFDEEEREILDTLERSELKSVSNKEAELERHRKYAAATLQQDQRLNIRISHRDLKALQKQALIEGISYQTLGSSILHKYVEERLIEKPNQV